MVGVGGGRHVEVVVVHLDGSVQILLAQIQKSTGDAVRPNHPNSFLGLLDLLDLLNQDSPGDGTQGFRGVDDDGGVGFLLYLYK